MTVADAGRRNGALQRWSARAVVAALGLALCSAPLPGWARAHQEQRQRPVDLAALAAKAEQAGDARLAMLLLLGDRLLQEDEQAQRRFAALAAEPAQRATPGGLTDLAVELRGEKQERQALERRVEDLARLLQGPDSLVRRLDALERSLRDDGRAETLVRRLELESQELRRRVDQLERDLARLRMDLERIKSRIR